MKQPKFEDYISLGCYSRDLEKWLNFNKTEAEKEQAEFIDYTTTKALADVKRYYGTVIALCAASNMNFDIMPEWVGEDKDVLTVKLRLTWPSGYEKGLIWELGLFDISTHKQATRQEVVSGQTFWAIQIVGQRECLTAQELVFNICFNRRVREYLKALEGLRTEK